MFKKVWNLYYRAANQFGEPCWHVAAFYRLKMSGKA